MARQALVIAGGPGTRLWPLTATRPKHVLPVAGVPFLDHQLAKLAAAGVEQVVLATSYRADVVAGAVGDGSAYGLRLDYAVEPEPLGTGGAIRNAAARLAGDPADAIVVLNGDILSGHDIVAQVEHHLAADADVTLHLVRVADPRAYGCVPTDGRGRVEAFEEKTPDPAVNQINAGCYVFRRSVIDTLPADRAVSVEREIFPGLIAEGRKVLGHVDRSYWLDVGTPAALVQASYDLVTGRARSPAFPEPPGDRLICVDAVVDEDAALFGGTTVGAGAVVAGGTFLERSVLFAGAHVELGARVIASVVGQDARVGASTVLRGAVVGDRARVGARCELLEGVRVAAGAVVDDGALRYSPLI